MNRDKQIEEMAKTMLEASQNANVEPVLEMEGKEVVLGENATKILNNILEQAYIPFLAEKLTDKGYRKASEVVRDIFNDLNEMWHKGRGFINYSDLVRLERLHEQKYTEGEG